MVIMMKQKKMKWKCPSCSEESIRKWNIEVHIKRRHIGHALPVPFDHDASVKQQERYSDPVHHSRLYNIFGDQDVSKLWPFTSEITSEKDPLDDILNAMQSIHNHNLTISMTSNTRRTLYNQTLPPALPRYFGHHISRPPFHNNIGHYTYPSEIRLQKENFDGVIGFNGKVCKSCLIVVTIPRIRRRGNDPVKMEHSCNPDRIREIQHLTVVQKNRLAADLEANIPKSLIKRCKEWTADGAYLRAYPIDQEYSPSIMINSDRYNKDSWCLRAINETEILLKDFELSEFLMMVRDTTADYFCVYSSLGAKQICHYLFVIKRKPLDILP
jgi:hypothetical protein